MTIIQDVYKVTPKDTTQSGFSVSDCETASLTSADDSLDSTIPTTTPKKKNQRRRRGRGKSNQNKQKQLRAPQISLEEQQKYLAMDCEMVGVGNYGRKSALARVVLVNWQNEVVLDLFIQPDQPVTDYRTFVSGITPAHLENAMDLVEAREQVLSMLEGKILVGHGLKNDLNALSIRHPWQQTRDTAKYEPFMKVRFDDNILWPRKLKELCELKLRKQIQVEGQAHSPVEDAIAALDLYKHAYGKWEKVMAYKIQKTQEIEAAARQ